MPRPWTRRKILGTLGTGILGYSAGLRLPARGSSPETRTVARYRVAVVPCSDYGHPSLSEALQTGWRSTRPPSVRGRNIVIKPNIADFSPKRPIHTNAEVVRGLITLLLDQGARQITIAEGTPQNRDSEWIFDRSGYAAVAREFGIPLIDLNYDRLRTIRNASPRATLLRDFWLPETILRADVVISVAKMKTHKLAGVTLCLKNMFGIIPGMRYGWPKNVLHWNGIPSSVCEINSTLPPAYSIVDGIVGMEGHGPIMGSATKVGVLVLGDNAVAVDATAARIMGVEPARVDYLAMAQGVGLGAHQVESIDLVGESVHRVRKEFALLPQFQYLRSIPR